MKSKFTNIFLCSCSFLLGVAITLLLQHVKPAWSGVPSGSQGDASISKGPWGVLDELEIPLGDSTDLFVDRPARLLPARWFFENYSKEQLEALLRACDLSATQWGLLQQTNVVTIAPNGIVLAPPDELVWTLNPVSRAKLYEVLSRTAANYTQNSPFCFSPDRFAERLRSSGIPGDKQSRIYSLIYTNGEVLYFSDLQLLPSILTTNELDRISEALYRVPAYRLRVRIYPDSDIDAIVKYWGQQGREKLIRPLIQSLTRVPNRPNGTSINISYFLPPTARLRLFTYPSAWPDADTQRQDCFWTSLNFFRDPPDPRYLDSHRNKESLDSEYKIITTPPTFGDLVVLVGSAGNGLHACVYIADDFVFTKNGLNKLQPWVLMKMSDMMAVFATEKPARMVTFRRKDDSMLQSGAMPANGKEL